MSIGERQPGPGEERPLQAASLAGAAILVVLGLGAVALGGYLWSFEAARPPSPPSSGGLSFAGLGYALAIVLFLLAIPPIGAGLWIAHRPSAARLLLGTGIGGGYGLVTLLLAFRALSYERGRALDPGTATVFVVGVLFMIAAALLVAAVAFPEPVPRPRRPSPPSVRRPARWRDEERLRKPPPGYGPHRP